MKKNAFIVASSSHSETVTFLEKLLVARGFDTLRMYVVEEAIQKLTTDLFSVLICVDEGEGSFQREWMKALSHSVFGKISSSILLAKSLQKKDPWVSSLLDQYFELSADLSLVAEYCEETTSFMSQKPKRSSLEGVSIPLILHQASRMALTGALIFEQEEEKCIIYVEKGFVVFASSNRDQNRFGEFLVSQNVISREQFLQAVAVLKTSTKRFGQILVDQGVIKAHVLEALVQSQIKHIIYSAFDWSRGEFYILFDQKSPHGKNVARFDVPGLVIEGIRYRWNEQKIQIFANSLRGRISLTSTLGEIEKKIQLGKNELEFLRLVGSGRPLEDLLTSTLFSRAEILKLIYAFQILGLIQVETEKQGKPSSSLKSAERMQVVDELFSPKQKEEFKEEEATSPSRRPLLSPSLRWIFPLSLFLGIGLGLGLFQFFRKSSPPKTAIQKPSVLVSSSKEPKATVTPPPKRVLKTPTPIPVTPSPHPSVIAKAPQKNPSLKVPPSFLPPPTPFAPVIRSTPKPAPLTKSQEFAHWVAEAEKKAKMGALTEALGYYRKASKLKPENMEVKLAIGDTLFDLNFMKEAKEVFQEIAMVRPDNAKAYLALGTIYLIEDQTQQAIWALRKFLALVEQTPENQKRILEAQKILQGLENTK